jgi:tetratricopeptide (TPR) repeat protein
MLVAIGCYACLGEAAQIYGREASRMAGPSQQTRAGLATAYTLMAFRERELGLPESAAYQLARSLGSLPVDAFELILQALSEQNDPDRRDSQLSGDAISALVKRLENPSTRGLAAAYAFVTLTCNAAERFAPLSPAPAAWLSAMREKNAVLRYAALRCATSRREEGEALLSLDFRFAEVNDAVGVEALGHGQLRTAQERFQAAFKEFPGSVRLMLALADVELAMARFDSALVLYHRAFAVSDRPDALLGIAKALTYLERHEEAVTVLNRLLKDTSWNPAEKYYWRAWNLYRSSDNASAHRDVEHALAVWSAPHVQRLAGLTALALGHHEDARAHFVAALALAGDECESRLYLAQLDSAENAWATALEGLNAATLCFSGVIAELEKRRADRASDASAEAEIERVQQWRASSLYSAAISAKILRRRELALDYARRLLQDPGLGGLARDFMLDIDVPPPSEPSSLLELGSARPPRQL